MNEPAKDYIVRRADDGDVAIMTECPVLAKDRPVEIRLDKGVLSLHQDGTLFLSADGVNEATSKVIRAASKIVVVNFRQAGTPDERIDIHEDVFLI